MRGSQDREGRDRRLAREVALTGGAVLGSFCLLVVVLGAALSITPLVFRSGSMGPGIPTGSLGLARTVPAAELRTGQVVSVLDAGGTRVTHRIVAVAPTGDAVSLTLRGDANTVSDPDPYVVREADRVFWSAPGLGYAVSTLSGRTAAFVGGLLVGVLAMIAWGRRDHAAAEGPEPPPAEDPAVRSAEGPEPSAAAAPGTAPHRGLPVAGRVGSVLLVGLASLVPQPTRAMAATWTDTSTASSGSLTTTTVPVPAGMSCSNTLGILTFSWSAVANASYTVVIRNAAGTTVNTVAVASGTTSYSGGLNQPGALGSTGSVVVQAVRYTGNWTSAVSNAAGFSQIALNSYRCT